MVLLKHYDERGFVFYTNLESRKGLELTENPFAALLFHWKSLKRQIRIEGRCELIGDDEADAYFASRDRGSQIGAWASDQSRTMQGRFELEKKIATFTAKFGIGAVPRPLHWSGYRLLPDNLEFWDDEKFRLHERIVYTKTENLWVTDRLFP
jgi:pyridoxamine 5'-phosphate oxidase